MWLTIKSTPDSNRNYLWLGCNKKFVKLRSNQSKEVRFKLGFALNGVYDIGKLSIESQIRLNILDSTSVTSFDELMDNDAKSELLLKSNQQLANDTSGGILVYLKNTRTNRYELFKRLTQFTVVIQ